MSNHQSIHSFILSFRSLVLGPAQAGVTGVHEMDAKATQGSHLSCQVGAVGLQPHPQPHGCLVHPGASGQARGRALQARDGQFPVGKRLQKVQDFGGGVVRQLPAPLSPGEAHIPWSAGEMQ